MPHIVSFSEPARPGPGREPNTRAMTGHPGQRPHSLSLAQTSPAPATADIGPAIVAAREGAGLTQDDVAAALGTSRQAVGYWEQGKRTPRTEQMFQLAALFRTTVAGLLATAGDPPQPAVQTAAMLWRKSSVELDETARDGIAGIHRLPRLLRQPREQDESETSPA